MDIKDIKEIISKEMDNLSNSAKELQKNKDRIPVDDSGYHFDLFLNVMNCILDMNHFASELGDWLKSIENDEKNIDSLDDTFDQYADDMKNPYGELNC